MAVTRTVTIDNPGTVNVKTGDGEFLHFKVTDGGPIPVFSFGAFNNRKQADQFPGHPKPSYEWDHMRDPSQIRPLDQVLTEFSFLSNPNYHYKVDVCDRNGATLRTAMDIQYAADPTDVASESFTVILV